MLFSWNNVAGGNRMVEKKEKLSLINIGTVSLLAPVAVALVFELFGFTIDWRFVAVYAVIGLVAGAIRIVDYIGLPMHFFCWFLDRAMGAWVSDRDFHRWFLFRRCIAALVMFTYYFGGWWLATSYYGWSSEHLLDMAGLALAFVHAAFASAFLWLLYDRSGAPWISGGSHHPITFMVWIGTLDAVAVNVMSPGMELYAACSTIAIVLVHYAFDMVNHPRLGVPFTLAGLPNLRWVGFRHGWWPFAIVSFENVDFVYCHAHTTTKLEMMREHQGWGLVRLFRAVRAEYRRVVAIERSDESLAGI